LDILSQLEKTKIILSLDDKTVLEVSQTNLVNLSFEGNISRYLSV